ncbi:MAG: MobF family relaxase [Pirellulaceae bacterium]
MLRIIQNRAATSAKSYYSHGDYLSEGQEQIGTWGGKGAALLGLSGTVEKDQFDRLCDNLHPIAGKQLTPRIREDSTVGYDFNFHAPKSVSMACELLGDHRILDAFIESVDETMQEIEPDMKTRVRKGGANGERPTGNMAYATFIHHTARPVAGVPDMHLHAHCFVFNCTYDAQEASWKAGQFRDIKRDAPYFEAAFHARLAKRLAELGYVIERKGKHWELAGISDETKEKFCRRRQLIDDVAEEEGILNPKEKEKLAAKTREAKQTAHSMHELRQIWRSWLTNDESAELSRLGKQKEQPTEQISALYAVRHAVGHSFERASVVPLRSVAAEALRRGLGSVDVDTVWQRIDHSNIVQRNWRGRLMATTQEVMDEERAIVEYARHGKSSAEALNDHWQIIRDWLNSEQRDAIQHIVNSKDSVILLRGGAGTGKTSLMVEACEAIEAGGHTVMTFAPSAEASRGVLQSEGFSGATTVAELLVNDKLQESLHNAVIWIDEAGLLGNRAMRRLFELGHRLNARIILSGDTKQHSSVERGGGLKLLEQEAGLKSCETTNIQRQRARYRDAIGAIAAGDVERGYTIFDELGWIHEIAGGDRLKRIADDYVHSVKRKWDTLVVSPTNREAEEVTGSIRDALRAAHRLGVDDQPLMILRPRHLTEAERRDRTNYRQGDVIVFQQNAKGHKKGERIIVLGAPSDELLSHADRFQVYSSGSLPLAAHDRIRITANGTTLDGKHRLNNGAIYEVGGFTRQGDIRLTNGWIVSAHYGHLTHGYVSTSHSSQGKTVDHVIIAESQASFPAAGAEQFYVSASRGRRKVTVYTDDKVDLLDAVSTYRPKLSASELTDALTHRKRQHEWLLAARTAANSQKQQVAHAW